MPSIRLNSYFVYPLVKLWSTSLWHVIIVNVSCLPFDRSVNIFHRSRSQTFNIPFYKKKEFKSSRLQFVSSYRFVVVRMKKHQCIMYLSEIWFLNLMFHINSYSARCCWHAYLSLPWISIFFQGDMPRQRHMEVVW